MSIKKSYVFFNTPNILQENTYELFEGFDMVHSYIDHVLVTSKHDFLDHLKALEKVLQKLAEVILKVNTESSFFGCTETDYIGFWVSKNGVRPLLSKL